MGHVGDRCWSHMDPQERLKAGWAPDLTTDRPTSRNVPPPEAEPPLRLLPRLPSDAEVIEGLRRWAVEFDELDHGRYTAQEFVEWLRLEHRGRGRVVPRITM